MENDDHFKLPKIIELTDYKGDFHLYFEAVYALFKRDFIDNKPTYRGVPLHLKHCQLSQGKDATFWHMTSKGENEETRTPDFRRLERIQWPAPMINHSEHPYLKVWENTRGNNTNILILHNEENYLLVLRRAKDYIMPWTAYLIEHKSRKRKLIQEYENYIKSKER